MRLYNLQFFVFRISTTVTERPFEQTELLKLGNHWMKSQSHTHFNIIRDRQTLCSYENALKSKDEKLIDFLSWSTYKVPSFLPIVINMIHGGTIKAGCKIYFPGTMEKVKKLFALEVLHAPFFEMAIIGLVTTACYSLRRGYSSALGLISGDAVKVFLQGEHFTHEDPFYVAIENETNAKYYVGKFNILKT